MNEILHTVLSNFGFVMLVLAVGIAAARALNGKPFAEELLRWALLLGAGVTGIYAGLGHIFMPDFSAELIGWQDSPFQYEVGVADFAVGVVGIMAFWASFGFRAASAIVTSILFCGDAIGHIRQMIVAENFAPGNAGSWFWIGLLLPIVLLGSLVANWRQQKPATVLR